MKTILSTSYAEVTYDESLKLIKVVWKDMCTSAEYHSVFEKALEFAQTTPVRNFISDIRKQKVVSPEERKWFQEKALPAALEAGLQRACVIFTGDIFKKYYLNHIMNSSKRFGMPFKFFSTEAEAMQWLKKMHDE